MATVIHHTHLVGLRRTPNEKTLVTKTFRELAVDTQLADALEANGITTPFPIQESTLPLALSGADLIGQARTGTGKTLAFGIPVLQRIDPARDVTQALIIVPTRELCLQVTADLKIGERRGIRIVSVYGGVGYDEQTSALDGGAHVVVGTPGRLLDLLNKRILPLGEVTELVLDEADEMLDMGFLPDVERLIEACTHKDRHTMLFSATMPSAIVTLGRRYLTQPTFMRAEAEDRFTAPQVIQHFFLVHRMDKPRLLARILQDEGRGGVFVFVRTKHMADRLVAELQELRTPAVAVHGDLRQTMREKNLDKFRSGKATVLVCTEVAARGLDISGVTHVVNYDCPDDDKMYLHRIGRTARAGAKGTAITFAEYNEVERLSVIRKTVGARDNEPVEVFSTSAILAERFTLPDERPWDTQAKPQTARSATVTKKTVPAAPTEKTDTPRQKQTASTTDATPARPSRRRRSQSGSDTSTHTPAEVTQTPTDTTTAPTGTHTKDTAAKKPAPSDSHTEATTQTRVRTRARATTSSTPSPVAPQQTVELAELPAASVTPTAEPAGKAASVDAAATAKPEVYPTSTPQAATADMQPSTPARQTRQRNSTPANPAKTPVAAKVAVSDDPLTRVRGAGAPRSARRVVVEHLP